MRAVFDEQLRAAEAHILLDELADVTTGFSHDCTTGVPGLLSLCEMEKRTSSPYTAPLASRLTAGSWPSALTRQTGTRWCKRPTNSEHRLNIFGPKGNNTTLLLCDRPKTKTPT